jgi:hypothetical protein
MNERDELATDTIVYSKAEVSVALISGERKFSAHLKAVKLYYCWLCNRNEFPSDNSYVNIL